MKNYLSRKNEGNELGYNFWSDPFEDFFKPLFYGADRRGNMRTDIKETDKEYLMKVDLPGFDKKDIKLTLNNGYLTVEAESREEEEDRRGYLRQERSYSCSRSYYVGDNVKEEDVKAKYENGILSLSVPKKEEREIRGGNIEIE